MKKTTDDCDDEAANLDDPTVLEKRVLSRCVYIDNCFQSLKGNLSAKGINNIDINKHVLLNAVESYFHDIRRVKNFHAMQLGRADRFKVAGYTMKWLAKMRPIFFSLPSENRIEQSKSLLLLVNAGFALSVGLNLAGASPALDRKFANELLYDLHYREFDGGIMAHIMRLVADTWPKTPPTEKRWAGRTP